MTRRSILSKSHKLRTGTVMVRFLFDNISSKFRPPKPHVIPVGPQDGEPMDAENTIPDPTQNLHFDNNMIHGGTGEANPNVESGAAGDPYTESLVVSAGTGPAPLTCGAKCAADDRLAKEHCNIIRKRVAQWMKDSGCPSSVKGFKKRSKVKASCGVKAKTKVDPTKMKMIRDIKSRRVYPKAVKKCVGGKCKR